MRYPGAPEGDATTMLFSAPKAEAITRSFIKSMAEKMTSAAFVFRPRRGTHNNHRGHPDDSVLESKTALATGRAKGWASTSRASCTGLSCCRGDLHCPPPTETDTGT